MLGGALGLLAGIGALAIPGVGPLIAAPIMAALAGVGVGGAVGGFTGALIGLGIPEYLKRSATKDACRRAAFCSPSTAILPEAVKRAKEIMRDHERRRYFLHWRIFR